MTVEAVSLAVMRSSKARLRLGIDRLLGVDYAFCREYKLRGIAMRYILVVSAVLLAAPVFGQSIYKCPPKTPGDQPVIQQMPCSPTGGGETMNVKPLKSTGSTLEINEQGKQLMEENNKRWAAQAEAAKKERERQEALAVERRKAEATEDQARAQRATANAILFNALRR
jgi:hypothetical protein